VIVRPATPADAPAMASVLNAIIAIGGTTAHEVPKSEARVREDYVDGPDVLASIVVEAEGRIIGWQSVGMYQGDPHIGTFVQPGVQANGAGQAMFAETCAALRGKGVGYMIAHIRADNVPGLAYYARIGFREIGGNPDFALQDGRKVGRIHRRFDL
jgi:L-amino acid N-acyltransferase YncA